MLRVVRHRGRGVLRGRCVRGRVLRADGDTHDHQEHHDHDGDPCDEQLTPLDSGAALHASNRP